MDATARLEDLGLLSDDGSQARAAAAATFDEWNWGEEPETDQPEDSDEDTFEHAVPGSPGRRKRSGDGLGRVLHEPSMWSISADGTLLAVANENEFVLARRIPTREGASHFMVLGRGSGCERTLSRGNVDISALLCHSIVIRHTRLATWQPCALVGYTNGDIKAFSEDGALLLALSQPHVGVVRKLTYRPGSLWHRAPAEFHALYDDGVIVAIDAITFLTALRAALRRLAGDAAPSALGNAAPVMRKYVVPRGHSEGARVNDVAACEPLLTDGPGGAAALYGPDSVEAASPSIRFLACGSSPTLTVAALTDEVRPMAALEVASTVATKLTSAVFGMAKGWLGGSGSSGHQHGGGAGAQPPTESATPLSVEGSWDDAARRARAVTVDPSGRLAAVTDNLGRVLLVDMADRPLRVLRWWKSYRHAQCAWIEAEDETAHKNRSKTATAPPQRALFLAIYAPRRGLLEVWSARQSRRVGAWRVGSDCQLLQGVAPVDVIDTAAAPAGSRVAPPAAAFLLLTNAGGQLAVRAVRVPFAVVVGPERRLAMQDRVLLARMSDAAEVGDVDALVAAAHEAAHSPSLVAQALAHLPASFSVSDALAATRRAVEATNTADDSALAPILAVERALQVYQSLASRGGASLAPSALVRAVIMDDSGRLSVAADARPAVADLLFGSLLRSRSAELLCDALERLRLVDAVAQQMLLDWLVAAGHTSHAAIAALGENACDRLVDSLVSSDGVDAFVERIARVVDTRAALTIARPLARRHPRATELVERLEVCESLLNGLPSETRASIGLCAAELNQSEQVCIERLAALHRMEAPGKQLPPLAGLDTEMSELYEVDMALTRFEEQPRKLARLADAVARAAAVGSSPLRLLAGLAVWHSEAVKPRLTALVFAVEQTGRAPRDRHLRTINLDLEELAEFVTLARRALAVIAGAVGPSRASADALASITLRSRYGAPPSFVARLVSHAGRDGNTINAALVATHDQLLLTVLVVLECHLRAAHPLRLFMTAPFFNSFWGGAEAGASGGSGAAGATGGLAGTMEGAIREARRSFLVRAAVLRPTEPLHASVLELADAFGVSRDELLVQRVVAAYVADGESAVDETVWQGHRADALAVQLLPVVRTRFVRLLTAATRGKRRDLAGNIPPDVHLWLARAATDGTQPRAELPPGFVRSLRTLLARVDEHLAPTHADRERIRALTEALAATDGIDDL